MSALRDPASATGQHVQPAEFDPNPGEPLDRAWVLAARASEPEVEATLASRRTDSTGSPAGEITHLLRALRSIDLTTLAGDDTPARVRALCARARAPLGPDLSARLGPPVEGLRVAAVCVYHHFLATALEELEGSGVPVAVAAAGFPAGLSPLRQRVDEIRVAVEAGAGEIDAVINRSLVLTGDWEALYAEVREFREACVAVPLKVILATGELGSLDNVARASRLCMQAGADFIKTSTGKEAVNATYPAGLVMLREILAYRVRTGHEVGFKPAGGIRTPDEALRWLALVQETAGERWLRPDRVRIGASSLLPAIAERLQLIS